MKTLAFFAACLTILCAVSASMSAACQDAPQSQAQQQKSDSVDKSQKTPPPQEKFSVTHQSAKIGGQQINYTATVGTYVIKDDAGEAKATFFFVGYVKDGVSNPAERPLAFSYNGGPGSASLFVHMGFGPKRPVLAADGHGLPAPYLITDNEDSFLDATDLVFIDAISTGASRPVAGQDPKQFYGLVEDANYFADFIYVYITRNGRWASPKFLIGESYGTTRSAELSGVLQHRHQIYLSGIVMVSTYIMPPTIDDNPGNDMPPMFYMPTYATTAWYHHLLWPDLQNETVEQVAQQASAFADGEYAQALMKGDQLSDAERQKVVQDYAHFTALSPKYIEQSNLRIIEDRWAKELERAKRRTIGQLDSRFEGIDSDAAGERYEYDPSEASYEGPWIAAFQDYIHRDLKWDSNAYYAVSARVRPWDQQGYTNITETLRATMTQQAFLKVLFVCGYYDANTPFHAVEYTVDHLGLEPSVRKNVSFTFVGAGHMPYIDRQAADKLHHDVDAFIVSAYGH
jgi:carboxypeptidase C (cathepsin A)